MFCWGRGLGRGFDAPHAADVSSTNAEGSGVGKQSEPSVASFQHTENELAQIDGKAPVRLTFTMRLTLNLDVRWETVLWQGRLYIQLPSCLLPDGSKEGFVSLLEYAEEVLHCTHVIVCMKKDRSDRAVLMRTFMFLGFTVLPPGHELIPSVSDNIYMAYVIE